MYDTVNHIVLRITCFFFGHGEYKRAMVSRKVIAAVKYVGVENEMPM